MNAKKFYVLLSVMAVLMSVLACSLFSTTPTVSNVRLATDETGNTKVTSYTPSQSFFVFADLSDIKVGSTIEARWYAANVNGVDANKLINTSDYTYESGITYIYFKLGTTDGSDWPTGTYRVEIYLDGTKVGEQSFDVQ